MPATALLPELTLQPHLGDPFEVAGALKQPGVLLTGHFELLSGLHSDALLRFSALAAFEERLTQVVNALEPSAAALMPSIVLAPSTAGVALGWTLANHLALPFQVAAVDERGRASVLGEGATLKDHRVLLVNDVVTTGEGFSALSRVATEAGGTVIGAAWWLSRQDVDVASQVGAAAVNIGTLPLAQYESAACPECSRGLELVPARDLN